MEGGGQADGTPSKVLLLRGLPPDVQENEVRSALQPYAPRGAGELRLFTVPSANQAFVEFSDEQSATHALEEIIATEVQIRGQRIQGCYSTRSSVTTSEERHKDCRVLLVYVTNVTYPVELDVIYTIFSKHGFVEKVVSFRRNAGTFSAFVQFAEPHMASEAMAALNGRNIYDGCNTLQVQPSKMQELTVRANNSRGRDYTNPNLPTDEPAAPPRALGSMSMGSAVGADPMSPSAYGRQGQHQHPHQMQHQHSSNHLHGSYSPHPGYGGGGSLSHSMSGMTNVDILGRCHNISPEIERLQSQNNNQTQTPVLMLYHIDEKEMNTPDKIFALLSMYGQVERVKIFRDKTDTAMVQFTHPFYATLAQHFLQGTPVFGTTLQIAFSRNFEVKLPPQGSNGSLSMSGAALEDPNEHPRTKAFTNREQRCSDVEKYLRHVCKPSQSLFIGNLPDDMTEGELSAIVSRYAEPTHIQVKRTQPPQHHQQHQMKSSVRCIAVLEFSSLDGAFSVLMNCHNTRPPERELAMKVSFSKQGFSSTTG